MRSEEYPRMRSLIEKGEGKEEKTAIKKGKPKKKNLWEVGETEN